MHSCEKVMLPQSCNHNKFIPKTGQIITLKCIQLLTHWSVYVLYLITNSRDYIHNLWTQILRYQNSFLLSCLFFNLPYLYYLVLVSNTMSRFIRVSPTVWNFDRATSATHNILLHRTIVDCMQASVRSGSRSYTSYTWILNFMPQCR